MGVQLGFMGVQLGGKVIWAGLRGCGCGAGDWRAEACPVSAKSALSHLTQPIHSWRLAPDQGCLIQSGPRSLPPGLSGLLPADRACQNISRPARGTRVSAVHQPTHIPRQEPSRNDHGPTLLRHQAEWAGLNATGPICRRQDKAGGCHCASLMIQIKRRAAAAAVRPCLRPDPGSPPSSFPQVTCLDRSGSPPLPPLFACEMRAGRPLP